MLGLTSDLVFGQINETPGEEPTLAPDFVMILPNTLLGDKLF